MPHPVPDREHLKFREAASNQTKVAVEIENETPIEVEIVGGVTVETELTETDAQNILKSNDRIRTYTFADFGTKNERVTQIVYTSAEVGKTLTETFNYVLDSGKYRLTNSVRVVT